MKQRLAVGSAAGRCFLTLAQQVRLDREEVAIATFPRSTFRPQKNSQASLRFGIGMGQNFGGLPHSSSPACGILSLEYVQYSTDAWAPGPHDGLANG
jgi:hypothetical protein